MPLRTLAAANSTRPALPAADGAPAARCPSCGGVAYWSAPPDGPARCRTCDPPDGPAPALWEARRSRGRLRLHAVPLPLTGSVHVSARLAWARTSPDDPGDLDDPIGGPPFRRLDAAWCGWLWDRVRSLDRDGHPTAWTEFFDAISAAIAADAAPPAWGDPELLPGPPARSYAPPNTQPPWDPFTASAPVSGPGPAVRSRIAPVAKLSPVACPHAVGDAVRLAANRRVLCGRVAAGTRATVVAVWPCGRRVDLRTDSGRRITGFRVADLEADDAGGY